MDTAPLLPLVPLLLLAAAALLGNSAAPLLRREAVLAGVASALAGLLAGILVFPSAMPPSLWMLGALLTVLPLLDRARLRALPLAGVLGTYAALCLLQRWILPTVPAGALLPVLILTTLGASFIGSVWLGLHPSRFMAHGDARLPESPPAPLFTGWLLLAVALAVVSATLRGVPLMLEAWLAPSVAALVVLTCAHRREDVLAKLGQAIAAGVVIKSVSGLSLDEALLAGVAAAICVLRGEIMAIAVRLDEPPHALGALFLPAMVALLISGFQDMPHLGDTLQYLGEALALGIVLGLILWPLMMLIPGLRRAERE